MAREIGQIVEELKAAYEPQVTAINQQVANLPAEYQAQSAGLEQAKQNAFGDITNQASARGLAYSGMPIAEQSKYVGTKFLPAMAQLQAQQNQQKFSLTSALNELNMKKYAQAQAVRQQELDREEQARQAEANRQAQLQAAREQAARAARSYGGGGGGGSSRQRVPGVDDAVALVNSLRSSGQYGDSGYGAIAEAMRQRGYDISRDSVFDRGLRKAFGFGWQ